VDAAVLCLAVAGMAMCEIPTWAQATDALAPELTARPSLRRQRSARFPAGFPTNPPATVFTIPVGPLGFTAPGSIYLGQRNSLVSLDFLDENGFSSPFACRDSSIASLLTATKATNGRFEP